MRAAVRFDHVTKSFAHHSGQMLLRDRVAQLFRGGGERFDALRDVSFEVAPGDSLGLAGSNGAGKSTILNLATGVARPDAGVVEVNGPVAALLELGAGFHADLTGAENVRINSALIGLKRGVAAAKFEEIVEFSGVREFIHEPLRTYSSGMVMRLAFSVAISADPEILVIDEVLGVGDKEFAERSLERVRQLQAAGTTILLASHNGGLIRSFCNRALWLDHGKVIACGAAREVIAAYEGVPLSAASLGKTQSE